MKRAVLGLGANLGDRLANLKNAVKAIGSLPETKVVKSSYIYETEPFGLQSGKEQKKYLNSCVEIKTNLSARALLGACLGVEAAMGRERPYKNAPRTIDIDVLIYEGEEIKTSELTLPHARITERAFVMEPLFEMYSGTRALGFDFSKGFGSVERSGVKIHSKEPWCIER